MRARKRNGTLLTTSEVARMLHIHINTARRWSNRGVLRSCRVGPRRDRRFRREDIQGMLTDLRTSPDIVTNHKTDPSRTTVGAGSR
ncbi:MAG: helix-turn-helix domain-containing protein [Dehalococcoidales bacterium]|nr:MAG: helix-turn-helix domain-containing protein [Dehalococcoidales bacterium]